MVDGGVGWEVGFKFFKLLRKGLPKEVAISNK